MEDKTNGTLNKKSSLKSYINMNSDAEIYATKNNFQSLIVNKILDQWNAENSNPLFYGDEKDTIDLNKNYRILDIGCGDGAVSIGVHNTILNSKSGFRGETIGIDMHQEMVDFANKRLDNLLIKADISSGGNTNNIDGNTNRLSFQLGNICDKESLPEEWKHSFDLIISFNCMHWVENQIETLTNIVSLLKPNGKCFMVFSGERIEAMIHATNKVLEIYKHLERNENDLVSSMLQQPSSDFTLEEIIDIYKSLGKYILELKSIDESFKFPWKKMQMMEKNPAKIYEGFMKTAGFKMARIIPLMNLRFICLPSKEYMNKVHTSIFPNLHKVEDVKSKNRFVELYNLFCFEYNLKNHDSEINHLSPEHYVISCV